MQEQQQQHADGCYKVLLKSLVCDACKIDYGGDTILVGDDSEGDTMTNVTLTCVKLCDSFEETMKEN